MERRVKAQSDNKKPGVFLVLAFDEIHALTEQRHFDDRGRTINSYDILCDTIALFREKPLVAVTMSSNLNISRLTMPSHKQPFERAIQERNLPPPFTEFPFDLCYGGKRIFEYGQMNVDEVSTLGFMSKFGRPLYVLCGKVFHESNSY
jgi:hypothetical protein